MLISFFDTILDRKIPICGSLPRRPRQLEGREMSHDILEDSSYSRTSPNVSNRIFYRRCIREFFLFYLESLKIIAL